MADDVAVDWLMADDVAVDWLMADDVAVDWLMADDVDLSREVEVKSYNFRQFVLAYGPAKCYTV